MKIEKDEEGHWKVTHKKCYAKGPIKYEPECIFCANKRECFAKIYIASINKRKKIRIRRFF